MPIGFQSITDNAILQVDSERKCYVLKASGITLSTSNGGPFSAQIYRPLGIAPLFFVHEGDGAFGEASIQGGQRIYFVYTPGGTNVRWYEFDVISGNGVGNVGLQLFNSAGQLTFDAAQQPLLPYSIVSGVKPSANISTAINTNRTYAIHIPTAPIRYTFSTFDSKIGNVGYYYNVFPQRTGSNINFAQYDYIGSIFGATGPDTSYEMNPVSCIITDVHNFIPS
jgi:hypothetical protein